MGNYCSCDNPQQNQEHNLESQQTPRNKPEKLPIVTEVIKQYSIRQINNQSIVMENVRPFIEPVGSLAAPEESQISQSQHHQQQQQISAAQQQQQIEIQMKQLTDVKRPSSKMLVAPSPNPSNIRKVDPSQGSQIRSLPQSQRNQEETKIETLYDKIGKEEGVQTFVDNWMNRVCSDPGLRQYFEKSDQVILRAKMRAFVKFLIGAEQHWIGQSMQTAHKGMKITDEQFDCFIHHAVESLKMMKNIRLPLLKSITNLLQSTRDTIVQKEDEESKSNDLIQKLGGIQGVTQIVQKLFDKLSVDPILSRFYKNTDFGLIQRKYSCFIVSLLGDNMEWFGKSMKEAHQGRGISEDQYFQMVFYLRKVMEDQKIVKEAQQSVLDKLLKLKEDIVEQPKPKTLYQRLDERDGYERIMHIWLSDMFNDYQISDYFDHIVNKDLFVEKATQYFAHYCGAPFKVDDISISDFKITKKVTDSDFSHAVQLLKSNLQKFNIRNDTIQETLSLINSFKDKIITFTKQKEEEMKVTHPILQDMAVQTSRQHITEQEEDEIAAPQNDQNSVPQVEDQIKNLQEEEMNQNENQEQDKVDVPPEPNEAIDKDDQLIEDRFDSNQNSKNKGGSQSEEQPHHHSHSNLLVPGPPPPNNEIKLLKENQQPKAIHQRSGLSSLANSPFKKKSEMHQFTNYKYVLVDLLSIQNAPSSTYDQDISSNYTNQIIFEGELMRYMERQKTQLNRWILLNSKALLIYKDQLNARSFPMKPLYVIPLNEVYKISTKDALLNINSAKKQMTHALEIQLRDCYGAIAASIAALINGQKVSNNSPLKDKKGKSNQQQQQNNINFKSQGYDDTQLVFVSSDKKTILNWCKRIKSTISEIGQGDPKDVLFNKSDYVTQSHFSKQKNEESQKALEKILDQSLEEKEGHNDTTMNSQPVKDSQ